MSDSVSNNLPYDEALGVLTKLRQERMKEYRAIERLEGAMAAVADVKARERQLGEQKAKLDQEFEHAVRAHHYRMEELAKAAQAVETKHASSLMTYQTSAEAKMQAIREEMEKAEQKSLGRLSELDRAIKDAEHRLAKATHDTSLKHEQLNHEIDEKQAELSHVMTLVNEFKDKLRSLRDTLPIG